MEKMQRHIRPADRRHLNKTCWPSDSMEKCESISLAFQEKTSISSSLPKNSEQDELPSQNASQILWCTGMLSEPIPNGFYSVIPEKRLMELFNTIPSPDELRALGGEGLNADVILVDFQKDKKLSMLKKLILALVTGLNSNPAALVKKIAGLVSDVYKRPNIESPGKTLAESSSHMLENRCVQLLGQIKHGSCRPRAILFKVLADTVGLESRLVVGLPSDGVVEYEDSYRHMSVIVVINSVELLVDLMRFPGQLIPRTTKAVFMTHMSVAGESDSAENDSCDSPIEPNSPLYGYQERYPERLDHESVEGDISPQFHRRLEASPNISGPSLRKMMLRSNTSIDRKLSSSRSEPDIATAFWRHGRRKIVAEQRTANSSPEHPSYQGRRHSMLSGDRKPLGDNAEEAATSSFSRRSDAASTPKSHRMRGRSKSITPEIGDDIVRTVRAMNEAFKQNRLLKEQGDDSSLPSPSEDTKNTSDHRKDVSTVNLDGHEDPHSSQKALSLPSSPHEYRNQTFEVGGNSAYIADDMTISEWNRILKSYTFQNKALLPYEEWNIDFSELKVGTRVGIGFFGEVFRGVWNGTDVAIKVFLEQDLNAENMHDFCNEISILSRLRHPNVILFLGACAKPPRLSMVTEYMEMGSLYYLIHLSGQKKKLSWRRRLKMLRDICRGLMCIHRMKIVHRDLKSANCLVNKHWTVKICDFGLSRIVTESPMQETSSAGTPEWMAPELIRNEPFTEKCDIFSLGVIMWELYTLSRPWEGVPPEKVVYAVAKEGSQLTIPQGPLGKLISDCWAEPLKRPTCEEILSRLLDCEYSMC